MYLLYARYRVKFHYPSTSWVLKYEPRRFVLEKIVRNYFLGNPNSNRTNFPLRIVWRTYLPSERCDASPPRHRKPFWKILLSDTEIGSSSDDWRPVKHSKSRLCLWDPGDPNWTAKPSKPGHFFHPSRPQFLPLFRNATRSLRRGKLDFVFWKPKGNSLRLVYSSWYFLLFSISHESIISI